MRWASTAADLLILYHLPVLIYMKQDNIRTSRLIPISASDVITSS